MADRPRKQIHDALLAAYPVAAEPLEFKRRMELEAVNEFRPDLFITDMMPRQGDWHSYGSLRQVNPYISHRTFTGSPDNRKTHDLSEAALQGLLYYLYHEEIQHPDMLAIDHMTGALPAMLPVMPGKGIEYMSDAFIRFVHQAHDAGYTSNADVRAFLDQQTLLQEMLEDAREKYRGIQSLLPTHILNGSHANYRIYQTDDTKLPYFAVASVEQWAQVRTIMGDHGHNIPADESLQDTVQAMSSAMSNKSKVYWEKVFIEGGAIGAPVRDFEELGNLFI